MYTRYDNIRNKFVNSSVESIQDPLSLVFSIRFDFFPRIGNDDFLQPGLLTGDARRYLLSMDDDARVMKLDYFVRMLRFFSVDEPWWFTNISGLDSILKIVQGGGRLKGEEQITITARESLDMKFLSMMESYRSMVNDKKFMRSMLPRNLKRFDCTVYLLDPRILLKEEDGELVYDNDSQGIVAFKLEDCEFNFNDSTAYASSISNTEDVKGDISHSFSIVPLRVYEIYNLPTKISFGYTGTGYYSDDSKPDFNILTNTLRPPSMLMAEIGNEREINNQSYADFTKDFNNIGITDVYEETPIENIILQNPIVESNVAPLLSLDKLDVVSNKNIELKTGEFLNIVSNRPPRTVL